ncbi:hypothetical protein RCL1_003716 [Eukaryota sp. TZLM3-RCL]
MRRVRYFYPEKNFFNQHNTSPLPQISFLMSSSAEFRTKAIALAETACKLDHEGRYQEALDTYLQAIEWFMTAAKFEKIDAFKAKLREACMKYMDRAEQLKTTLQNSRKAVPADGPPRKKPSNNSNKPKGSNGSNKPDNDAKDDEDDDPDTAKLRGALEGAIVREKPNVKWEDVAGLDLAKEALREAVILPMRLPHLFTGKRTPWKGILLYGPPGTGKSYLAKAVATEVDSTFFSISSSDLVSKWQGESERLIKQLFELARANKPSIVFIDEIDSLCGARSDNESEASRRIKTEILVQMQGVGNVSDGILILGATNLPWNLDSAIRRRFEKRIYIPLPEPIARTTMFKIHIGNTPNQLQDSDYQDLGDRTEGFSGADINILVRDALYQPVRTLQTATHFKKTTGPCPDDPDTIVDDLLVPCSPSDPGAQEISLMDIPPNKVAVMPVTRNHFLKSLTKVKPSVGAIDIENHIKWTAEFGSGD